MNEFVLDIKDNAPPIKKGNHVKIVGSNTYDYDLYPFVDEYADILRTPAEHFNFDKPIVPPPFFAFSLIETMKQRHGVGLAAPQVGFNTRVFVMGADTVGYALFNPIIVSTKGEPYKGDEGCLSFPGLFLPIMRYPEITISYFDMAGREEEKTFSGFTARVAQHEIDHLDGVCFTTLVSRITLDRCKTKVKKNLKLLKEQRADHEKNKLIAAAMKNLNMKAAVAPDDVTNSLTIKD